MNDIMKPSKPLNFLYTWMIRMYHDTYDDTYVCIRGCAMAKSNDIDN